MGTTGIKEVEMFLEERFKRKDKSTRLIEMAFKMREICLNTQLCDGSPIILKIGIHKGEVIAGVIGYHKP